MLRLSECTAKGIGYAIHKRIKIARIYVVFNETESQWISL